MKIKEKSVLNQDQVKDILLQIENDVEDFKVIFSGKTSKKVNGLYYSDKKEIIIHNRNFKDDNLLIYTAIHEFAHHIHISNSAIPISNRSHTNEFWNTFHGLLIKAERLGLYKNLFQENEEFVNLTKEIKECYLFKNGELIKETGKLLIKAINLCQSYNVRFEDYVDRVLMINRTTANTMVKIYNMDINPQIGFDNMKVVSRVRDAEERRNIENDFMEGKTHNMVKAEIAAKRQEKETIEVLKTEKTRLEKAIERLNNRLELIIEKINKSGADI